MKLNDEAIGQIAKILQVAILTGTDVVDNLRQIEFTTADDEICLTDDYKNQFENNLSKMIDSAKSESTTLQNG
tara:strand:- start:1353 stop:1571 length:219 start_codon:yes stop_codon:yes gene_type:complete